MTGRPLGWRGPRRLGDDDLLAALAAAGLAGEAAPDGPLDPLEAAERLRRAIDGLGPMPRAFGRELGVRADVLPGAVCRAFAGIAVTAPSLPRAEVERRIAAALAPEATARVAGIDQAPPRVTAFRLRQAAHLVSGEPVEITVAAPGSAIAAALHGIAPLAAELDRAGLPGGELLADFRRSALLEADLGAEAEALTARGLRPWIAGERALVLASSDALAGVGIEAIGALTGTEGTGVGTRVTRAWLREALDGRPFSRRPTVTGTRLLADGGVAFVEGPFALLPSPIRDGLWQYLDAAVAGDPTTAYELLIPELVPGPGASPPDALRLRLRQVVAFRDGGLGDDVDPFVDQLFAGLRAARACGYAPSQAAVDLFCGLGDLALWAAAHEPGAAPVRRALEELRLERRAAALRTTLDPSTWAGGALPHAALLLELPQKLDAALDRLARGDARVRLEIEPRQPARPGSSSAAIVLAMLAAALVIAAPRLADLTSGGALGAAVTGILAAVLAASLVGRPRDR